MNADHTLFRGTSLTLIACLVLAACSSAPSLHEAAASGDIAGITSAIEHGADVNATDETGKTPLQAALWEGQEEAALLLIKDGADVTVTRESGGDSTLHLAVFGNCPRAVEELIARGVDVNGTDRAGDTPLHSAVEMKRDKLIPILLAHGANPELKNEKGNTPVMVAELGGRDFMIPLLVKK